jgi:hypothetical protein
MEQADLQKKTRELLVTGMMSFNYPDQTEGVHQPVAWAKAELKMAGLIESSNCN